MVVGTNSLSPLKRLTQNYFSHTVHNFEFSPGNGHKTNYKFGHEFGQFRFVSFELEFFLPIFCSFKMYKIEDKFSFSQSTRIMNQYLIRSLNVLHSMYVHKKAVIRFRQARNDAKNHCLLVRIQRRNENERKSYKMLKPRALSR